MNCFRNIFIGLSAAILLTCGLAFSAHSAPISVSASLDSVSMTMGNVTLMNLEVVHDENVKGDFPLLRVAAERGRATVIGDTIEVGAPIKADTVGIGSGRVKINLQVPVQAFDSGTYVLPPIWFVAGRDSAASKPLNLRIIPVKALATDTISPLASVVPGKGSSVFDNVPDIIYYYWWTVFVAAALIFLGWWYFNRRKKQKPILPKPVKVIPPNVEALEALERLKSRKLWERGLEKEYFTELTDILRNYLVRQFGINAMEMTSREIINSLKNSVANANRDFVRKVLEMADFVKFAKMRPLPADNISAYNNVYDFVKSTALEMSKRDAKDHSAAGKKSERSETVNGKSGKEVES